MVVCMCIMNAVNSQEAFAVQPVPLAFYLYPSSSFIKYIHHAFD